MNDTYDINKDPYYQIKVWISNGSKSSNAHRNKESYIKFLKRTKLTLHKLGITKCKCIYRR